jgi:class 3 adenylate cyclase
MRLGSVDHGDGVGGMMHTLDSLAAYVPAILADGLAVQLAAARTTGGALPPLRPAPYQIDREEAAVLFVDVGGFTRVAEAATRAGTGAEGVAEDLRQVQPATYHARPGVKCVSEGVGPARVNCSSVHVSP